MLVVDDTPANLIALRAVLEELGPNLVEASSGEEAIEHVEQAEFAAILLDVQMRGLDGFETAKRIRTVERSRHTPIIFLTAYESDRSHIEEAYSLGAVDFLVKPLVPTILRAKLLVFIELFQKTEQVRRQSVRLGELERQELRGRLATQYACARAMAEADSVDDALRRVLQAIGEGVGWEFAALWSVDTDGKVIRNVQTWHAAAAPAPRFQAVTRGRAMDHGQGMPGRVWATGQPAYIPQLSTDDNFPRVPYAMEDGLTCGFAFPIALGDEILGVMEFYSREIREPDDETLRTLGSIGNQLGQYIHRKRAEAELVRRARQLEVLSRASQEVNATLDVKQVMRALIQSALALAEAEKGTAGIMVDGKMVFTEYHDGSRILPIDIAFDRDSPVGIPSWVMRKRSPYLTNDAAQDPVIHPDLRAQFEITSALNVPIFDRRGELVACFEIHNKKGRHVFAADDVTALQGLAAATGSALDNAILYEQLRTTEMRNRQLADNLPAGFIYQILLRPDGTPCFSYVSGGVEALLGVTPYEVISDATTLHRLIVEEDQDRVQATEAHAMQKQVPFDCQFRTRARGGEVRWLHCRSAPHPLADGGLVWDGIAIDITDRMRAEDALREATAQLQLVTDTMAAAVTRCSRDLRYVWVSRGYAVLLDRSAESIAGQAIEDVVGADAMRSIRPYIDRVLAGHQVDYEEAVDFKGVGRRWISAVYVPTYDSDHHPDGWVAVITDITRRKQLEDALRDANRRKDEFLAMLAHELRNPLAPIRNAMEILRLRGEDPETVSQLRDMVDRQIGHLTHLVDDLLDVSRIMRGRISLKTKPVDLRRLVSAIADDRRREFEKSEIALTVELPNAPLWVMGDATRLTQTLDNLLGNAIKFTPNGGKVWVALSADGEKRQAVVRVADNGMGIEPEILPQLFESFSQADRSLDRSRGGLGLGLVLVKGLTELHGGCVEARSDGLNQGSVFTLWLPLTEESPVLEPKATSGARARLGQRQLRVVVIEDNRDAAESLRMLLELVGHEVTVAYTGDEGVDATTRVRPDVVICDLGLPGMDGFDVARTLRGSKTTAELRLIAVTGYGQESDRRKAIEAGFDDHIVKPADPGVLLSKLERRA